MISHLLVYQTSIFRISLSHQSKDVIPNDPLCESNLTVTEVVCLLATLLRWTGNGKLTKPFTLEYLDILRCHFWVFCNERRVDTMEVL